MRVLIAEDEARLAALLAEAITEAGWVATICANGATALAAARTGDYDTLLLDWMLPVLDGPSVIAALRADGHRIPILLLTARGELRDRVDGLNAGADDYLAKPFELDELLARLRALHRRGNPGLAIAQRAGDLFIDPVARRVERAGIEIDLSAREFDILLLLMQRAGQVVSRYTILDEVWDGDTDLRSNVIDVHVATLRSKVDRPFGRSAIQTVRGAGYRLDAAGG
ncbi:MAG: response regulator transcription factor [Actinobacteria bacterium]|nr:MAG: response regulator transcription factor [Actinomycetota bacterium]